MEQGSWERPATSADAARLAELFRLQEIGDHGRVPIRSTWTMHKGLDAPEPAAEPPEGVVIATLAEHPDERALYAADREAFREHFGFSAETFDEWRARGSMR